MFHIFEEASSLWQFSLVPILSNLRSPPPPKVILRIFDLTRSWLVNVSSLSCAEFLLAVLVNLLALLNWFPVGYSGYKMNNAKKTIGWVCSFCFRLWPIQIVSRFRIWLHCWWGLVFLPSFLSRCRVAPQVSSFWWKSLCGMFWIYVFFLCEKSLFFSISLVLVILARINFDSIIVPDCSCYCASFLTGSFLSRTRQQSSLSRSLITGCSLPMVSWVGVVLPDMMTVLWKIQWRIFL